MPKKSTTTKLGRPEHVPTAATRRSVSIRAGGGMTHEEIAMSLGISRDTLRKYYRHELSVGAQKRRGEVLEALYNAAMKKGTSAAARSYLGSAPEFEAPPLPEGEQPPAPPPAPVTAPAPAPAVKRGKKEQAALDAKTAADGTEWAELLPNTSLPQ